ncbi:hypothetical protein ACEN9H_15890 [Massilia cellulosiltytica]|uniref:hypothetical protein n=1 Tax=Massilia cellulosiltytica TaxID=2683234 RepID=UPI0039B4401D
MNIELRVVRLGHSRNGRFARKSIAFADPARTVLHVDLDYTIHSLCMICAIVAVKRWTIIGLGSCPRIRLQKRSPTFPME